MNHTTTSDAEFHADGTTGSRSFVRHIPSIARILMGLMFYGVPAGLCVYFIASSIWSIVERKSLPKAIRPAMALRAE